MPVRPARRAPAQWAVPLIGASAAAVLCSGVGYVAFADPSGTPSDSVRPVERAEPTTSPTPSREQQEAEVRAAFAEYEAAVLAQDGDRAVRVISERAYGFYDRMRRLALTAPPEEVERLRVVEQLTVYALRAELAPEVLRSASPAEIVAAAIDAGTVSEQSIRNLTLGRIGIDGISAGGQALRDGEPSGFEFSFVYERDEWRFDLVPLINLGNVGLQALANQEGITASELVERLLVLQYGAPRTAELKTPPGG